jgi:transglutaminase-like putative cysteine protease
MKYRITHTTTFLYEARVGLCYNLARLRPRVLSRQQVSSAVLSIDPGPHDHCGDIDYFGNRIDYFSIQRPHEQLVVTAVSDVQVSPPEPGLFDRIDPTPWEAIRDQLHDDRSPAGVNAVEFTLDSPMVAVDDLLADYARPSFAAGRPLEEAVHDLMRRIHADFKYDPDFSSLATPLGEVLEHRSGVCQDFAHLAIGCLRSRGLAARYVSGYIETDPPPGKEKLVGTDASHAWFAVFHPAYGWLDFDPTNNQRPGERHITVAWGRDYTDVTPLKGVAYGSGEHQMKVAVDVKRVG